MAGFKEVFGSCKSEKRAKDLKMFFLK